MTITFDEAQHPRESSGRFTTKAASESGVGLDTQTAATQARVNEHEHSMGELNMLERTLAHQLSQVRTDRIKHELSVAVAKADASGNLPPAARYVTLSRDENEVNDYGSVDCIPSEYLDGDGRHLGGTHDTPAIHQLVISLHADESGPDLYDEDLIVWREDAQEDAIDLDAVRDWSADSSTSGARVRRWDFERTMRRDRELSLARSIRDTVRAEFPSADTVHMVEDDFGALTYTHSTDIDGKTVHRMYETETSDPSFDDDLDEKVREMTQDSRSVDVHSSWPSLSASAAQDKHTGTYRDASLDLGLVDAKFPPRRSR